MLSNLSVVLSSGQADLSLTLERIEAPLRTIEKGALTLLNSRIEIGFTVLFFVVVMHFAAHTAKFDQLFAFIFAII